MKDIIIEMRDGVVQEVYSDEQVRVFVVDWDERKDSTESCAGEYESFPTRIMPEETRSQVRRIK